MEQPQLIGAIVACTIGYIVYIAMRINTHKEQRNDKLRIALAVAFVLFITSRWWFTREGVDIPLGYTEDQKEMNETVRGWNFAVTDY